jgi:oxalate decarboxylase/phosphoglucose isomerase-like protein (cupin superfamily)
MRSILVGAFIAAGLMPAIANAQSAAPPPSKPATGVSQSMLEAAEKIGRAALKPGVSVSDRNISLADIGAYAMTVAFVTRPATKTPSGSTLVHDKITEIYYVLRGSGTSLTGTLVNGTHEPGSTTIGPGWRSDSPLKESRSLALHQGEMQIIPPGLGHVWSEIADGGIDYLVIRVDPEHVLGLSK